MQIPVNLKEATIFDLTSNSKIIKLVVGYLPDKAEYVTHASQSAKACAMIDFATLTKDEALLSRLNAEFGAILQKYFNE